MKSPDTIREAVEQLQSAVQAALPGMSVTVAINLVPMPRGNEVKNEVVTEVVSLGNLRNLLNAYAKSAGKESALELVGRFSNGTGKPQDISQDDYPAVIKAMGGYELETKGDT